MNIPENLRYRDTHEWVEVNANPAACGISDHAQHELTEVVFVDLPKVGRKVQAGDVICTVDSVKSANDIYAPVSGEVVAVNEALMNEPGLLNRDPYLDGWLFKLQLTAPSEVDQLMTAEQYIQHIG